MIVLDTHIWVWWVHGDSHLREKQQQVISSTEDDEIGVSIISCWEAAKLVEHDRLFLPYSTREWFAKALDYPGVTLLELTPDIIVESTSLPGSFHRDPADQLIVATARIYDVPLVTSDTKIQLSICRDNRIKTM